VFTSTYHDNNVSPTAPHSILSDYINPNVTEGIAVCSFDSYSFLLECQLGIERLKWFLRLEIGLGFGYFQTHKILHFVYSGFPVPRAYTPTPSCRHIKQPKRTCSAVACCAIFCRPLQPCISMQGPWVLISTNSSAVEHLVNHRPNARFDEPRYVGRIS
jgi:hypothetical protein